jgi:hypothetical protein
MLPVIAVSQTKSGLDLIELVRRNERVEIHSEA